MATFEPNQPIVMHEPVITVDAGLAPGRYRFRLVVVDDEGNASAPDEVVVEIVRVPIVRPDPILRPPVLRPPFPRRPGG